MLNENFKGHENWGKIYERPHVPKKGTLFSYYYALFRYRKIFRRWRQKKCKKLTLLNKVVYLWENYFFLKVHEKIRLFNPTNALIAKQGRYVFNSNPPVPDYSK